MDEFLTFGGDKIVDFDNPFIAAEIGNKIDSSQRVLGYEPYYDYDVLSDLFEEYVYEHLRPFLAKTILITGTFRNSNYIYKMYDLYGNEVTFEDIGFLGRWDVEGYPRYNFFYYDLDKSAYATTYAMKSFGIDESGTLFKITFMDNTTLYIAENSDGFYITNQDAESLSVS